MCAVVLLFLISSHAVAWPGEQTPDAAEVPAIVPLEDLLTKPITPGLVALLVEHPATDVRLQNRLRDALAAEDAAVRAVAARVVLKLGLKSHSRYLVPALAKEKNRLAAEEQLRALMLLLGAAADDLALREARRIGGRLQTTVVEVIGRQRPDGLLALLPELFGESEAEPPPSPKTATQQMVEAAGELAKVQKPDSHVLAMIAIQHPSYTVSLGNAVMARGGATAWRRFLDGMVRWDTNPPDDLLIDALRSPDEEIREATVWFVLGERTTGRTLSSQVTAAAIDGEPVASWEGFGRDLLRRMEGEHARVDWTPVLATVHDAPMRAAALSTIDGDLLTKGERRALREEDIDMKQRQHGADTGEVQYTHQTVRTVPALVPPLVTEVMSLTGCAADPAFHTAAATLVYGPDGLPREISLGGSEPDDKSCEHALRILTLLSVAPPDFPVVPEASDTHLLLVDKPFLACGAEPLPEEPPVKVGDPKGGSRRVKQPKKTRNVDPLYPERALREGAKAWSFWRRSCRIPGAFARSKCDAESIHYSTSPQCTP